MTSKGDISTFQIVPAFVNEKGDLIATFGLFDIIEIEDKATSSNTQVTGLTVSVNVGILNTSIYGRYRDLVQKQLAEHLKEYIFSLKT